MSQVENAARSHGAKGLRTRARILESAEEIFGRHGFHDAAVSQITRAAGLAQGSFYLYFPSKQAIFEELIRTRGRELHSSLSEAALAHEDRVEAEAAAIRRYFAWIAEHRWLYRVVRLAEFVAPELREDWYRGFAEGYALAIRRAMDSGQLEPGDPELTAWAVMGICDSIAMRTIVWGGEPAIAPAALEEVVRIALRALGARAPDASRP